MISETFLLSSSCRPLPWVLGEQFLPWRAEAGRILREMWEPGIPGVAGCQALICRHGVFYVTLILFFKYFFISIILYSINNCLYYTALLQSSRKLKFHKIFLLFCELYCGDHLAVVRAQTAAQLELSS